MRQPFAIVTTSLLVSVLLLIPRTSLAQTAAPAAHEARVFVDVNLFGAAESQAKERTFTSQFLKFAEVASSHATYPKPGWTNPFPLFDVGGGVMLKRTLGIGVVYGRTTHEDVADLGATIPHPTFLNAAATGTGVTDEALTREEATTHVFVAWVPVRTAGAELRFYGGPSFVSYTARMVNEVHYTQTFDPLAPQQSVTISGFASEEAKGRGLGLHAGGDVAYFFTPRFGVSGGVRFMRGTVTVEEPMSRLNQEIKVGGTLVLLGVRVRFGG